MTMPGTTAGFEATHRQPLYAGSESQLQLITGRVSATNSVDGGQSSNYRHILRKGTLMGFNTVLSTWTPLKLTYTQQFTSSGDSSTAGDYTSFKVDNADFFMLGDVISVGSDTLLTITAINYDNNLITVDEPIDYNAGELVRGANGWGVCRGILWDDNLSLRAPDNITDTDRSAVICVGGGVMNTTVLLGDITAALADSSSYDLRNRFGFWDGAKMA